MPVQEQKLEMYTVPDELFLVQSRLKDIYINGQSYTKQELLQQIENLHWILQEL